MYKKLLLIALIVLTISSCKKNTAQPDAAPAPIKVETAMVKRQEISNSLTFNGITKYQQREDIRANVTGYISWMPFQSGDLIQRGQAFAAIRTKEQDALRDAAKIDSSLAKFSKPLTVSSNASGVISSLKVNANDYVSEGDIMATVSQPSTLSVQVSIPFEFTNKVSVGTPCKIILRGQPDIDAEISRILNSTDSIGQAQHYLIRLPNEKLPENLNVQVKIVTNKIENALTIPKVALQTDELLSNFWVLKIVNDTLATKQVVTPLIQTDSLVQIESDFVKPNDRVIVRGGYQMQDSTTVSIEK